MTASTPPREHAFEAGGLRWGALEWGSASAPLVVALHGWLDNAASFSLLGPLLSQAGYRIFALDLPGHGRTRPLDAPDGPLPVAPYRTPMHFVDYVAPVHAALEALSPQEPALMLGHSMGAAIALMYAGTFPERVRKLSAIEGLGPISGKDTEGPERLRRHVDSLETLRKKRPPVYPVLAAITAKRAQAGELSLEAARLLLERAMERTPEGWIWRTDPMLRLPSPYRLTEAQVIPFLSSVTCPVQLFAAEGGFGSQFEGAKARLAALKDLRLERVPGGHHVHMDDPKPLASAIAAFLGA